jgi:hypothetical protein
MGLVRFGRDRSSLIAKCSLHPDLFLDKHDVHSNYHQAFFAKPRVVAKNTHFQQ